MEAGELLYDECWNVDLPRLWKSCSYNEVDGLGAGSRMSAHALISMHGDSLSHVTRKIVGTNRKESVLSGILLL